MAYIPFRKNNKTNDLLASALAHRDNTPINITPVQAKISQPEQKDDIIGGALKLGQGLYNSGLFNRNGSGQGLELGTIGNSANDYILGNNAFGGNALQSAINNDVMGGSSTGNVLTDSINSEALGSGGGGANWGALIGNAFNSGKTALNGGNFKDEVPQAFFGINKDDSDVMQGINGTLNGATTGFSVGGPWGALIGGIAGLGSSFLDDF